MLQWPKDFFPLMVSRKMAAAAPDITSAFQARRISKDKGLLRPVPLCFTGQHWSHGHTSLKRSPGNVVLKAREEDMSE